MHFRNLKTGLDQGPAEERRGGGYPLVNPPYTSSFGEWAYGKGLGNITPDCFAPPNDFPLLHCSTQI